MFIQTEPFAPTYKGKSRGGSTQAITAIIAAAKKLPHADPKFNYDQIVPKGGTITIEIESSRNRVLTDKLTKTEMPLRDHIAMLWNLRNIGSDMPSEAVHAWFKPIKGKELTFLKLLRHAK